MRGISALVIPGAQIALGRDQMETCSPKRCSASAPDCIFPMSQHEGEASSKHSFKRSHCVDLHQHHVDIGVILPPPTFTRRQLGLFSERCVEGLEPHSLTASRPVGGFGGPKRAKVVRIERYCPGIRPPVRQGGWPLPKPRSILDVGQEKQREAIHASHAQRRKA